MNATIDRNIPWIDSPFFRRHLDEAEMTEEDKAFVMHFADNGYAIFDPGIDESVIDSAVREMKPMHARIEQKDKRIQDAWTYNQNVRRIASADAVMKKLRMLYQREPLPFQTLNFIEGTEQKTHSDMIHFNSIPQRFMCGVWVALEDINDDNGPLHYYPGSHKLPFYDMIDIGVRGSDNLEMKRAFMTYAVHYETFIEQIVAELGLKKHKLNIKKGQAIIWAANLLHGGEPIRIKGTTRLSQVTHYYFDSCMYYTPRLSDIAINKIYLSDLVNIKTGEKIVNHYFDEEVKPTFKFHFQQSTVRMLAGIAHIFPESVVDKI